MDHLSSCYFCGAALDEALGAYTVGPSKGGQSVTLCASCRHKLDRLLDATGTGETMPTELAPTASVDARTEDDYDDEASGSGESEPRIDEKEPTAQLEGQGEPDTESPDEKQPADISDEIDPSETTGGGDVVAAESSPETVDEWEPDPAEWGESADSPATPVNRVSDRSPEPLTTNPEELSDDEEIQEIPGLAVDDNESAAGNWETDIQDEMEPNVPDSFAETESESDADESPEESPEADTEMESEDDSESTISDELEDIETSAESDPLDEADRKPISDDEPVASDSDETGGLPDTDKEESADEDGIDPSILQADDIATGNVDIEEALDGESDVPDGLTDGSEAHEQSDSEESQTTDDNQPTADPETNGEEAVDPEEMDTEDPFDLDTGPGEPETTESVAPDSTEFDDLTAEIEESEDESGDGGFDFDADPGTSPDEEEEALQSEMEADLPEELRTGSETESEDPTDAVAEDLEAIDAMDTEAAPEDESAAGDTADRDPSEEEVAFGEEDTEDATADRSPFEAESEPTESGADDHASPESGDDVAEVDESGVGDPGNSERSDGSDEQRRSISALEYNKVMRLLQNREFPVDRMELMAVAASTYDLSEADCAEVLNIAIDRGLLAEDGNKLVKPD